MTDKQTILPPELSGVMHITGYQGIGKSWLAFQADLPQNLIVLNFDKQVEPHLPFKEYRNMLSEIEDTEIKCNPLDLFDYTMDVVSKIEKDAFTVAIIDNVTPLEQAIKAEAIRNVDRYCKVFGLNKKNVLAGRFGGANAIMNFWISNFTSSLHSRGIQLVIITSHIGNYWNQGIELPNKHTIKGGRKWSELSILTLVLMPGTNPPIPDAQVAKESLGEIVFPSDQTPEDLEAMMRGESGHKMKGRLPKRIPECTFQKIRWYLANPADIRNPKEGEAIVEEEIKPFSKKLSKAQITFIHDALKVEQKKQDDAEKQAQALDPVAIKAKELKAEGKSMPQIAKALNITVREVAEWTKNT